jgi:hypothetical protein
VGYAWEQEGWRGYTIRCDGLMSESAMLPQNMVLFEKPHDIESAEQTAYELNDCLGCVRANISLESLPVDALSAELATQDELPITVIPLTAHLGSFYSVRKHPDMRTYFDSHRYNIASLETGPTSWALPFPRRGSHSRHTEQYSPKTRERYILSAAHDQLRWYECWGN